MKRFVWLATAVLLVSASSAFADDTSKGEVSVGWRYYHGAINDTSLLPLTPVDNFPKGWYADVSGNVSPKFAIVGEAGGTYQKANQTSVATTFVTISESADVKFYTFMGGVRVRAPQNPRLVPFGQVLFGGDHVNSVNQNTSRVFQTTNTNTITLTSSNPVLALDGGLDIVFGWLGARTTVGYSRFFKTASADELRVSIGLVYRF